MIPVTEGLALLLTVLVYVAAAFLWPSFRVWKKTGLNPYVLPTTDDVYGLVTSGMRAVMTGIGAYAVLQLGRPELEPALGSIAWLRHPALAAAAWAGLALALVWTVVTQMQMGVSWRIGIDRAHATALVTTGLFAWSRNPIFLGMRVCLLSLFLLRPNALTLALLLSGELLIGFQVRLEEAFLRERHGAAYAAYCARVGRWL